MKINLTLSLNRLWTLLIIVDVIWVLVLLNSQQENIVKQTKACLTLIDAEQKTWYQWSSDHDHPPFQKGQWRWNQTPDLGLEVPKLIRLQQKKPHVHYLSQGTISDEPNLMILYDDWDKRTLLKRPLRPAPNPTFKKVILLDHSATMNNSWLNSNSSAWQVCLQHLLEKRSVSSDTWEIITFASNWFSHGLWPAQENFGLQNLGTPQGKTKWSETLESWLLTQPAPSYLIMIGDGKIEERNLPRLKTTLEQMKSQGHQITALSPELKALDSWQELYQTQLVNSIWPEGKQQALDKKIHSNLPIACEWSQVNRALAGQHHLPLIWSNEGYLLMSCEMTDQGLIYHLAGIPSIDPLQLLQHIKTHQQQAVFIEVHPMHTVFDFQSDSKAPLSVQTPKGPQLVWPEQWGIYNIHLKSNQIRLTHPQYGLFQLDHVLDFQNRIFNQTDSKQFPSLNNSLWGASFNFTLALAHLALLTITVFQLKNTHD